MEPRSRRVPGADGLALHLLEWSAQGVPMLFLHGFGNEAHIWDDLIPALAPYYRCLALDMRGHGRSDWDPERRYDHASMARDVEAVLAHLAIPRCVLVGHSMGGRVAMRFAGRLPERLAGLIIVDAGPDLDVRGVMRIREDAAQAPDSFTSVEAYEMLLTRAYPMATGEAIRRMAAHALRRRDDARFVHRMDPSFRVARDDSREAAEQWAADEAKALWDALAKVACPTLVVRGAASDVLAPETADRMVDEALAHGTLEVIAQAGHSVMTDNPEGLRKAVERFALGA
ncbi:MAG: alpha/beta hydrolase [Deltaproteobacteria bacterium]|nr:MAG: alpha/beta hydrolase [Deltaproteobacteria bacterium]